MGAARDWVWAIEAAVGFKVAGRVRTGGALPFVERAVPSLTSRRCRRQLPAIRPTGLAEAGQ